MRLQLLLAGVFPEKVTKIPIFSLISTEKFSIKKTFIMPTLM